MRRSPRASPPQAGFPLNTVRCRLLLPPRCRRRGSGAGSGRAGCCLVRAGRGDRCKAVLPRGLMNRNWAEGHHSQSARIEPEDTPHRCLLTYSPSPLPGPAVPVSVPVRDRLLPGTRNQIQADSYATNGGKNAMETGFALSKIDTTRPCPARDVRRLPGGKDNYPVGRRLLAGRAARTRQRAGEPGVPARANKALGRRGGNPANHRHRHPASPPPGAYTRSPGRPRREPASSSTMTRSWMCMPVRC